MVSLPGNRQAWKRYVDLLQMWTGLNEKTADDDWLVVLGIYYSLRISNGGSVRSDPFFCHYPPSPSPSSSFRFTPHFVFSPIPYLAGHKRPDKSANVWQAYFFSGILLKTTYRPKARRGQTHRILVLYS